MKAGAGQDIPSVGHGREQWMWLVLTVAYSFLILKLSLRPYHHEGPVSLVREAAHNALHMPAYTLLTLSLMLTLRAWGQRRRAVLIAFVTAVAYGAFMELLQNAVPGRMMSLGDVALNTIGAAAAVAGMHSWLRRHRGRKPVGVAGR